jgi:hypothetical protein
VTNDFVAPLGFDHLRCKSNATDTAAEILEHITVGALADNMAEAKVADMVTGRAQAYGIQQIRVALDLKNILMLINTSDCNTEWI